jgi:nucleotide-binding universal stress UspA family protein
VSSIRKILVPTDFSPGAAEALRFAVELARPIDAALTLLHAYQLPSYYFPDGSVYTTSASVAADIISSVTSELERARRDTDAQGVAARVSSVEGQPAAAILEAARGHDLVVMGTHGRTGLRHLLLGSVAEKVVRSASCPVLTVRTPG